MVRVRRLPEAGMRSFVWLARRVGWRRAWRYERDRRRGATIDYATVFTADELAVLGEHIVPCPWERA